MKPLNAGAVAACCGEGEMAKKLPKDLREFIELLNSHGVEYVLVGAYAMAYHARPR